MAPLLLIGNTSLIAISTLTSEINFYTRLLRMRDKVTGLPLFTTLSIQLACKQCIEEGKAGACVHMLHLVPRWQSSDRHVKLKTIMQDRPDLIESELSGLAFDSNQQIFKTAHIETMFAQLPPTPVVNEAVYIFIDPAAGGPQSDYAVLSVTRQKGMLTVSLFLVFCPVLPETSCTGSQRAGSRRRPRVRCGSRGSTLGRAPRTGCRRTVRPCGGRG